MLNYFFLDRNKLIRNHSALTKVHFSQGNRLSQNSHLLLEKKLKNCFLPEKISPLLLSNPNFMPNQSDNKFTTNETTKLERHKAFYESFRIVQPKGLKIKQVNEKKYIEKPVLLEESTNEKQSSLKEEFNEKYEFSIREENEQKYEYADIFGDNHILKLLKNCFFGIKKNYNQNEFILNIMSQKNSVEGFFKSIHPIIKYF